MGMGVGWLWTERLSSILAHGSFVLVRGKSIAAWLGGDSSITFSLSQYLVTATLPYPTSSRQPLTRCKLGQGNIAEHLPSSHFPTRQTRTRQHYNHLNKEKTLHHPRSKNIILIRRLVQCFTSRNWSCREKIHMKPQTHSSPHESS